MTTCRMGVKLEKTSCFWRAKGSGRWENRGCHKMQPFLPEKNEVKSAARRASAIYNWQVKLSHLILLCLCLVLSVYCKFKGTLQHRHHGRVWPRQQPSAGRERPLATKAGTHGVWAFCSQQLSMRMLFLWSSSWLCPYLFTFCDPVTVTRDGVWGGLRL